MSLDELKAARAAYPKAAELAEFKQKMASLSVLEKAPYLMSLPKDGLVRTEYLKFAEQKMLAENINFLTALEEGQDFESLYENFIIPPNDNAASPFAESKPGLNLSTAAKGKAESAMATLEIALNLPGGDGEIVSHARQGCDDALAMCKREIMSQLGQALSAGSNSDFLKTPLFAESPYQPVAEPRRPMTDADFDGTKGAQRSERGNAQGAAPSHRPEPAVVRTAYDPAITAKRSENRAPENIQGWKDAISVGVNKKNILRELIDSPKGLPARADFEASLAKEHAGENLRFCEALSDTIEFTGKNETGDLRVGVFKGNMADAQALMSKFIGAKASEEVNVPASTMKILDPAWADLQTLKLDGAGNLPAGDPKVQAFTEALLKAEGDIVQLILRDSGSRWTKSPTAGLE